jgi:hypothetical protein
MTANYLVLGQVSPTGTAETTLYTVPSGKSAVISTLFLSNVTHLSAEASIFVTVRVRPAGASAVTKHIIVPGSLILARRALTITAGITLATTDVVTVQSSVANGLAATLCGTEMP